MAACAYRWQFAILCSFMKGKMVCEESWYLGRVTCTPLVDDTELVEVAPGCAALQPQRESLAADSAVREG